MPPTSVTTPLQQESAAQGGFYVPRYEVQIDGANLPRDLLYDVRSITYKDDLTEIDNFTMTVNNWDDEKGRYKYVGSETLAELEKGHANHGRMTLFEPCGKDVVIRMGYGNNLKTMVRGRFTSMTPTFGDGASELSVGGLNVLHQLRRKKYSTTWTQRTDSQIATNIASLKDGGKARFPLPITIDDNAANEEKELPLVRQSDEYDIDFLYKRAQERGYVIFVQEEDKSARPPRERRLYFGRARPGSIPGLRDVTFEFAWGRSLVEFKPSIQTANQVTSVTVRGWHRTRKQTIVRKVTLDDPRITTNKDLHRLLNECGAREEVVVDEPMHTNCQARERAIAILDTELKKIVTADVRVIGLPDLRAGQNVVITGLGARLSGRYLVTSSEHTINDSGYLTSFKCRREAGVEK